MFTAVDISQYFLRKGEGAITQLKLQKLLYYSQGFYLATCNQLLFSDVIEAWDYGPVVVELRREFGCYGSDPISVKDVSVESLLEHQSVIDFLEKIWRRFGSYTAGQLVNMTHQEEPWLEAYQGSSKMISQETMKNYFTSRLDELEESSGNSKISQVDVVLENSDFLDLSDLEEAISSINTPKESFDSQFSQGFIEFSDKIAEKLAAQVSEDTPDHYLREVAKSLASYTD